VSGRIEYKLASNSLFFHSTSDPVERVSLDAITDIKVGESCVAGERPFAAWQPGLGMIGTT
jgi:hypothetical protein